MNLQKIKELPAKWRAFPITWASCYANELEAALNEPEPTTEESSSVENPTVKESLQVAPFDPTKPVQTIAGREAVIYSLNGKHPTFPIIGEIKLDGSWLLAKWKKDGSFADVKEHPYDLINIPEPEVTIEGKHGFNVYGDHFGGFTFGAIDLLKNLEGRRNATGFKPIACIPLPPIKFREGDGL